MKLLNFRAHDPAYTQTGRIGLSRGNKLEKELWDEFGQDLPRLKIVAASIRASPMISLGVIDKAGKAGRLGGGIARLPFDLCRQAMSGL